MINKHCKGCLTHIEFSDECGAYPASVSNRHGDCPCTDCLIKAMCKHGCEDYDKFHRKERWR